MQTIDLDNNYSDDLGFRTARYVFIAVILIVFLIIFWFGRDIITIAEPCTLTVYCYSGMETVMERAIFPLFKEQWFNETGEQLEFIATFAGSGEITRRVIEKFPAEVAILSSKLDIWQLTAPGMSSSESYTASPHQGIIARTPLVMLVNENIRERIYYYSQLRQIPAQIILPNPVTSGAGQLGLLCLYQSEINEKNNSTAAVSSVKEICQLIDFSPSCAREALDLMHSGTGDILITYEANLLNDPAGSAINGKVIYPVTTIICEPMVLSIDRNIETSQKELVEAFINFLWTSVAQQALVDYGFRSVDEKLNVRRTDFGTIHGSFTIDTLGNYIQLKKILESIIIDIPN